MKINRFAHYRALTISAILAAVLWSFACSFYSTAISHCTSVGIKWEKGGVSPSELTFILTETNMYAVAKWTSKPITASMLSIKKIS